MSAPRSIRNDASYCDAVRAIPAPRRRPARPCALAPALIVGLVAAVAVGLIVIARRGLRARRQPMALGPFLAFGSVVAVFFGRW